jgi:hypothetical protein
MLKGGPRDGSNAEYTIHESVSIRHWIV